MQVLERMNGRWRESGATEGPAASSDQLTDCSGCSERLRLGDSPPIWLEADTQLTSGSECWGRRRVESPSGVRTNSPTYVPIMHGPHLTSALYLEVTLTFYQS